MDDTENKLSSSFTSDIDNIATEFINCFGLKHSTETGNLSKPIFRWLDFRLRYVDPKPRTVLLSNKFPKQLPDIIKKAFNSMVERIQCGEDINPYQGAGLILHHDTSGKKRQNRTDLLWADWGILHFHLSDAATPMEGFFSPRSNWLMFAIVGVDFLAIIDIRHHNEDALFSNPELIKIAHETWPKLFEQFELKGVLGVSPENTPTAKEYAELRKAGVTSLLMLGGKAYMGPGLGITTASTPLRVTRSVDYVYGGVRELARVICTPGSELESALGKTERSSLGFKLCIMLDGLTVYSIYLNKYWRLPRGVIDSKSSYFAKINELFAPEWAINRILQKQ